MKKLNIIVLIVLLALTVACSSDKNEDILKIAVVQFADHEALNDSYDGFLEGMSNLGLVEKTDYEIIYQNAQGDTATLETIADTVVNSKPDLIYAIATPAAQAVANKTSEIPIVVAAVTNPKSAGLVIENDNVQTNVTGVSDLTPVERQIELLKEIDSSINKVAVMYANSEDNSRYQADLAKTSIEKLKMEYIDASVSDQSQIQQMVESLVNKVDAIYVPTDNLVSESFTIVSNITNTNDIVTVVGEVAMVRKGGLITDGISYKNGGVKVAEIVYDILINKIDIKTIPILFMEDSDLELAINKESAKQLKISFDDSILSKAHIVE